MDYQGVHVKFDRIENHKFCTYCGDTMVVDRKFIVRYNHYNGDPLYHTILTCSRSRSTIIRRMHDTYEFDELGNMITHRYD
jgi:hypothetical protein